MSVYANGREFSSQCKQRLKVFAICDAFVTFQDEYTRRDASKIPTSKDKTRIKKEYFCFSLFKISTTQIYLFKLNTHNNLIHHHPLTKINEIKKNTKTEFLHHFRQN